MVNDLNYSELGKRIKHYRLKNHLTQESLAAGIDVSTSTIAHAESGTSKPSLPLLMKVCRALGITLDQLVCDSLPVVDTYISKDFSDLLADCSTQEKQILLDVLSATKSTLRKNRK